MTLIYYGRPNCALCDEGKQIVRLVQEDVDIEVIYRNIEDNDIWHEQFLLMIPVIEYQNEIIMFGHIDYVDLLTQLTEAEQRK